MQGEDDIAAPLEQAFGTKPCAFDPPPLDAWQEETRSIDTLEGFKKMLLVAALEPWSTLVKQEVSLEAVGI